MYTEVVQSTYTDIESTAKTWCGVDDTMICLSIHISKLRPCLALRLGIVQVIVGSAARLMHAFVTYVVYTCPCPELVCMHVSLRRTEQASSYRFLDTLE